MGSKFGLCELVDEDDDLVTPQTSRNATTSLGLRRRVLNKLGSVVSKNPWFPKSHFPSLNPQFLGSNNGKSPFEDPFGGFFQWGIPKSPRVHSYSNALTTWMIWGTPILGRSQVADVCLKSKEFHAGLQNLLCCFGVLRKLRAYTLLILPASHWIFALT